MADEVSGNEWKKLHKENHDKNALFLTLHTYIKIKLILN